MNVISKEIFREKNINKIGATLSYWDKNNVTI